VIVDSGSESSRANGARRGPRYSEEGVIDSRILTLMLWVSLTRGLWRQRAATQLIEKLAEKEGQ
jgi:hypothetical protein